MPTTVKNNDAPEIMQTPEGLELKGNLSFGRLGQRAPGPENSAGMLAVRTGQPQLCGWITGMVYAVVPGEGAYGSFKRLVGEFFALDHAHNEISGTEIFLPGVAERFVLAGLQTGPVAVRYEGWVYPDATAPRGYSYRVFVRQPPGHVSLAKRMAIEAGLIEPPDGYVALPAAPPPVEQALIERLGDHDDGTPPDQEEARIKDGLAELLGSRAAAE